MAGRFINGKFVFPAAAINDPELSAVTQIAWEDGFGCAGEVACGGGDYPHLHLRITGQQPEAGPRYEAIPLGSDEAHGD